jgi:hypothetical protein
MKTPTFLVNGVVQANALAADFLYLQFGCQFCPPFRGLIIVRDKKIAGAAIFNNFHPGCSVDITAAGAFGVREVRALAYYAFRILDCRRVTAITSDENRSAARALKCLGFKQEGIMRERFGGHDGLVFGLLRSEQKLIKL